MSKYFACCFGWVPLFRRKKTEQEKEATQDDVQIMETQEAEVTEETVQDVLTTEVMEYLSKFIGYEWGLLAKNLGLTRKDLAVFENLNEPRQKKVFQMLCFWLEESKQDHKRLRRFIAALDYCGRKDLGEKVHCAQWSEQNFNRFEMPPFFPMLVRINKVRPQSNTTALSPINDLNPTSSVPVHSLNPRFIPAM